MLDFASDLIGSLYDVVNSRAFRLTGQAEPLRVAENYRRYKVNDEIEDQIPSSSRRPPDPPVTEFRRKLRQG